MTRARWASAIGLATGLAGLAVMPIPFVSALEDSIGLHLLFQVRGAVHAPAGTVVVSVDETAATRLGLPPLVRDWPRSVHAALVDRLVERGASAVAFDIQFFKHGVREVDEQFAQSIARSRRVVLVQRYEVVGSGAAGGWERQDPIPELADRAIGLAPAPLPDRPAVSWAWSFLTLPNAADVPSLPAVMLQLHAMPVTATFLDILGRAGITGLESLPRAATDLARPTDLMRLVQSVRRQVQSNRAAVTDSVSTYVADTANQVSADNARLLRALADLYVGPDVRHLNFYGPPGTICTLPIDALIGGRTDTSCPLEGAVVFVGLGSGRVGRTGQPDTYHTVYPVADGVDFSGVEIQATVLSNFLAGTTLRSAGAAESIAVALVVGLFGAGGYWVRTRDRRSHGRAAPRLQAAAAVVTWSVAYMVVAYLCFRYRHTILPLVVPLGLQVPVALVLALLVPPARRREEVRAVCLATDAAGSTAVGQRMPHGEYARLMDHYRQTLLAVVQTHEGEPVPPVGDGFVSVWRCRGDDAEVRLRACTAALEIVAASERLNQQLVEDQRLPTRIGLTLGTVTIHSDADRGVFEVFGDAVNVAARLRDLNVQFGTRILAADTVVARLDTRLTLLPMPQGFALKGVSQPPVVFAVVRRTTARYAGP